MPVKRLNFTNRSKLTREQANVRVHPGNPAHFEVELDLSQLPRSAGKARVFVEAYHRTTRMRFPFGTVANLTPPPPHDLLLTEFSDWKDVSFRVKVTDCIDNPGRIIAWANNIRPRSPTDDDRTDLVRWKDAELDGRLWDLEFDENGPVVLVEKSIGHANIGQDQRFIAIAYPEILRRALSEALLIDKVSSDDSEHWFAEWNRQYLTEELGLRAVPDDADDLPGRRSWIDDAVSTFGSKFNLAGMWLAASKAKETVQ